VITARRRLKKWQTYTSINRNGRYYTLPQIPVFDQNGLWKYQAVLFSKHGNLKQTIVALIINSPKGLSAVEIAEFVDLAPNSSYLSRFKSVTGVKREKHEGRYIYLSDQPEIYTRQKQRRASDHKAIVFPTDAQAVVILVQLIKYPGIDIEKLADKVLEQGQLIEPATIRDFLRFHDLLKKIVGYKAVKCLRCYIDKIARDHSPVNLFEQKPTICFYPQLDGFDSDLKVLKSREKNVITLDIGPFRAKETILRDTNGSHYP
jgi:hypothetical protein